MKRFILSVLCFCLVLSFGSAANAGDYPDHPIQIVVPYSAGGGTDLSARVMAKVIRKYLGVPMVVVDQPGGSGAIGTSGVSHSTPDGYTLGMGAQGPLTMLPCYGGIDYTKDSFDYLALMGRNLILVGVNKDAPFQDGKELIEWAKAHPGKLTVGVSGAGGAPRIATEGFAAAAGIKVKCMPFNGSAPAITACVGGHIDAVAAHPAELVNQSKAGNINLIMVMEPERIALFPDVPTTKELGVNFTWAAWKGVIAPKGLPAEVKAKLEDALNKTFHDPEFLKKMENLGEFIDYRDGAGFKKLVERDSEVAEKVIRSLNMYGMNEKKK
jgi:tripartite-type tricarboxylate transporter receptor subunit TctC